MGRGTSCASCNAGIRSDHRHNNRWPCCGRCQTNSNKPNILVIMGDDIGWMQPSIYHRGLMVGETPNIDRIGNEGAIFMDYLAMQSCTSGRNAFFTGMYPLRTGMIPPQLPGSPSYLRPGTPALASVPARSRLHHRRVRQEPSRRPHRVTADSARLPGVLGLALPPGRDAAGELPRHQQQPNGAGHRATVQEHAGTRPSELPDAVDPRTATCLTPPRPVIWCHSSDGTEKNQTCKDEGPLTLERSKTVDEEISAKVIDFLDRNDPKKTSKPFFVWYNPARMHVTTVLSQKYVAMMGTQGRQGLGHQRSRHEADGRQHRLRAQEAGSRWANWTTPSSSSPPTTAPRRFPSRMAASRRSRVRRARHGKAATALPCVVRWPGHIKPGTVKKQMFAALDWLPTFVDIAGGPKGDELKKQIEAGKYPGIVKTTLDGFDQRAYLEGTVGELGA